jgi:hypothetical protein
MRGRSLVWSGRTTGRCSVSYAVGRMSAVTLCFCGFERGGARGNRRADALSKSAYLSHLAATRLSINAKVSGEMSRQIVARGAEIGVPSCGRASRCGAQHFSLVPREMRGSV